MYPNLIGLTVVPTSNSDATRFISGPYPVTEKYVALLPYKYDNVEGEVHSYIVVKNPYEYNGKMYIDILSPVTGNTYGILFEERLFNAKVVNEKTYPTCCCCNVPCYRPVKRQIVDGSLKEFGYLNGYATWRPVIHGNVQFGDELKECSKRCCCCCKKS